MSELVLCINLKESKKKHFLVLETYSTNRIRTNKTKQFSGQLQKIDFTHCLEFKNINFELLNELHNFLHSNGNIQFSKYQFSISSKTLPFFKKFVNFGLCFYCDSDNHFYQIEACTISQVDNLDTTAIKNIDFRTDGVNLNFTIGKSPRDEIKENFVYAKFYIDISSKVYKASLFFEYQNTELKYTGAIISKSPFFTRNYFFEKNTVELLNKNEWQLHDDFFEYTGKNVVASINELQSAGVKLYSSHDNKTISAGRFTDASISYNIDWFEFSANIQVGDASVDAIELFNLKNKKNWVEFNNQLVLLPESYYKYKDIFSKDAGQIRIEKKNIGHVLAFSNEINIKSIKNIESLTNFYEIVPCINNELKMILRPYQKVGVQWLLYLHKNNFGGCLADDMGLGKTIQVLAYLSDASLKNTCNLIIVPKTLIENWKREISRFLPNINLYIYHNKERNIKEAYKNNIILTTYGTLINNVDIFIDKSFENIIIDEAQNIKNFNSVAYKIINMLSSKTKLLLTGTPFENNINEFVSLMNLVNPGLFPRFSKSTEISADIISKIKTISSPFLLQRLKKDVLTDLPEKSEKTIYCEMDSPQRELYNRMLKTIQKEIKRKSSRFEIKSNALILNGLLYLQQVCCHPKLLPQNFYLEECLDSAKTEMVLDMLQSLISTGHKTVVFSRFTKMLKILSNLLEKMKISFCYLDGKTENRMKVVDDFEKPSNSVFLVSLKAGGVGLNLTSADTAIIYDPWWNPAIESQAEDRIYRIGQRKNVTIYRLIMSDTIEEKIEELKQKKKNIADKILENEDSITGISIDILRDLILE